MLDSNSRAPILLIVENRKAYSARGVYIRVKERRCELALGWLSRVILRELHGQLVDTTFPVGIGYSRNASFPPPVDG